MCKLNLNSFKHVVMCWSYVIYSILFEWFEFELKKRVIRRAFRFIVTEHGFSGAGFPVIPPGGLERLCDAWPQRHTAFVAKPTKFPSQRWTKHINRWDVKMCHDVGGADWIWADRWTWADMDVTRPMVQKSSNIFQCLRYCTWWLLIFIDIQYGEIALHSLSIHHRL